MSGGFPDNACARAFSRSFGGMENLPAWLSVLQWDGLQKRYKDRLGVEVCLNVGDTGECPDVGIELHVRGMLC